MDKLSTDIFKGPIKKTTDEKIKTLIKAKPYLELYFNAEIAANIALLKARNDFPVLAIKLNDGETKLLASKYDPMKEASRMIPPDLNRLDSSTIILILGLGNPLTIALVLQFLKPGQICIALDSSFELGTWLCNYWPGFEDFLSRPGCHLFCGVPMDAYLDQYMDSLPADNLSGVRVVSNRTSKSLNARYYLEHEKRIQNILQSRMSDLLTRFQFEPLWIRNIISNSRYLSKKFNDKNSAAKENLLNYAGVLKNVPGVLVSAGPSLPKSFDQLKLLKNKAFILACDTALKPLLKANIIPHAIFVLDAQKHTLFHLIGETDLEKIILFTDIVINPFVLRNINPGAVIFSTTSRSNQNISGKFIKQTTPGTEFIEDIHGQMGCLQSGGSVATSAFDLLRFLGCNSIIFTGQDLAYTGRQIHSCGVHHYEKWNSRINRLNTLENINEQIVKKRNTYKSFGIAGEELVCDYVLDIYKNWFDDSIAAIDLPVYNLTKSGNIIQNTVSVPDPDDFIDQLRNQLDLAQKFQDAKPLQIYKHKKVYDFIKKLELVLLSNEFSKNWTEFAKQFPVIQKLNRKIEIYVKRNHQKLEKKKIDKMMEEQSSQAAAILAGKLKKYFL